MQYAAFCTRSFQTFWTTRKKACKSLCSTPMMTPMNYEYIASERFIHDGLLRQAEAMVRYIYESWKHGEFPDILFAWPGATIQDDSGKDIEGIVCMVLPKEDIEKGKAKEALRKRVRPYGTLCIETKGQFIESLFRTRHGSVTWTIPIEDHGDVKVLGKLERTEVSHVEPEGASVNLH